MTIAKPIVISPDSSHWAKWLDAMSAPNLDRRQRALGLHDRLTDEGRLPLLSWHHMEELLGGDQDGPARARVAAIQELPRVAFLRLPQEDHGVGSSATILAAEAVAAAEGLSSLEAVRDRARQLLLRTGTGAEAIGDEGWVWEALRPMLRARGDGRDMIAAFAQRRLFDESLTIGELSKLKMRSSFEAEASLKNISAVQYAAALQSTGGNAAAARAMTDEFMAMVMARMPPAGITVRELIVTNLVAQGLDRDEIRDECVLGDLNRLATFRGQLEAVASETPCSFDTLKTIRMELLPSQLIADALRAHGQPRTLRPGSDVNDIYLGVHAAYCDVLYVDKRTAEDFKRTRQKEPRLDGLIGEIAKASDFEGLLPSN